MVEEGIDKILSDVGALLERAGGEEAGDTFLYAEAGDNWVGPSVFKELSDRAVYRQGNRDLDHRILDLWEQAATDKKWRALWMTVSGGKFDARFQYDEGWNEDEATHERVPRVLTAKFGDKPIDYPDYYGVGSDTPH